MGINKPVPSLLELCMRTAIDNIRYLGDVGETDLDLLKDVLQHCNVDQLMHIEKSTEGRDLSPATDSLWKRFYEQAFGVENTELVIRRMRQKRVSFKWRQLYEVKSKEREEAQQRSVEKFRKRFAEDLAKKQSRQVQLTSKVPPSSKKRNYSGGNGYNLSNMKSNLMKKAKLETLNSREAQIHATMRRNALQRNSFPAQSARQSTKPSSFSGKSPASSSKLPKPVARR